MPCQHVGANHRACSATPMFEITTNGGDRVEYCLRHVTVFLSGMDNNGVVIIERIAV